MNNNYPTPYTVGKIFHFRFTDKNGKRFRMSTGSSRKSDTQKFIKEFIDKQRSGVDTTSVKKTIPPFLCPLRVDHISANTGLSYVQIKPSQRCRRIYLKSFIGLSYITNLELRYVVVENVPGLEKKSSESGLDDFITDLEKMGISTNRAIFPRFVRWRVFGMWCRYFSRFTACSGREQQSI